MKLFLLIFVTFFTVGFTSFHSTPHFTSIHTTRTIAVSGAAAAVAASNSARRHRCESEFMSRECDRIDQTVLNYNTPFYRQPKLYLRLVFTNGTTTTDY